METREAQPDYLVIVPRDRRDLVDHLTLQYAGDPRVRVVHDRRSRLRPPAEAHRQLRRSPDFGKVLRAADVVIICRRVTAGPDEAGTPGTEAGAQTGGERAVETDGMTGMQFRPLIERTQHLLGGLVRLLDEHDQMQVEARRAEEERKSLRKEIQELQQDNESLRSKGEALWKEHQALLEQRNELLRERETLLNERERISVGLTKFMREVVQPMSVPRATLDG